MINEQGVDLEKQMGHGVINEYLRIITYYNQEAYKQDDENTEKYLTTS